MQVLGLLGLIIRNGRAASGLLDAKPENEAKSCAPPFALATPAGLEPATCRLEGGCSIQLSYGARSPRVHLTL